MRSTEMITEEFVKSHSACIEGLAWFQENFPNGGEYQVVLDKLAENNRYDWASWLLGKAGPSHEVREIKGDLKAFSYFFCGTVRVSGLIAIEFRLHVGGSIQADWSIKSGGPIESGGSILSGGLIESGWSIKSGGPIESDGPIKSGESIRAGGSIKSGESIVSGGSIKSSGSIRAGDDFGIFAAVNMRLSSRATRGKVIAKTKPKNLMTGLWVSSEPDSNLTHFNETLVSDPRNILKCVEHPQHGS